MYDCNNITEEQIDLVALDSWTRVTGGNVGCDVSGSDAKIHHSECMIGNWHDWMLHVQ